jgi:hypothetical protein
MAATLTETRTRSTGDGYSDRYGGAVTRIELAMVSHTDGTVSGLSTAGINGTILRVVTNPGATAPTDNYDVTLLDEDGIDVLAGQGADRDTANSEHFCPGVALKDGTTTGVVPVVVAGPLTPSVTNAGSGKTFSLILYVR